ncbi:MAG: MFS transporter [Treponema sp.]|nr:MFS transporter [Treponema sp.]
MHLILAHITVSMIYGVISPYLPIMLRLLGYRAAVIGILFAIAEGVGITGPFLFSRLADRSGNYRRTIIFSFALTTAAAVPLSIFIQPIASALLIAVFTIGHRAAVPLIDAITSINLGEKGNYGKIRVYGSVSYVCFILFLQWVPVLQPDTPLNISLWILFAGALAMGASFLMPSKYANVKFDQKNTNSGPCGKEEKQKGTLWTPIFILGLACIALSRMAMASIYSFFPLFMIEYMNWNAVGPMLALASIAEIPFILLSKRIIRRFGTMPLLAFTSAMVALRLGLYAVFPYKGSIIIAQLLHCFTFGLFHPAAIAFISNNVPPEKRSFGMTLYMSVGSGLPIFIGNFIGGFIIDSAGYRALFGSFTAFAILGAAIYVIYRLKEASVKRA